MHSLDVDSTLAASKKVRWGTCRQSKKSGLIHQRMSVPPPSQFKTDPGKHNVTSIGDKRGHQLKGHFGIVEKWSQKPSEELHHPQRTAWHIPIEGMAPPPWWWAHRVKDYCLRFTALWCWRSEAAGSLNMVKWVPIHSPQCSPSLRASGGPRDLNSFCVQCECHPKSVCQHYFGGSISCLPMKEILLWPVEVICSSHHSPRTRSWPWGPRTTS